MNPTTVAVVVVCALLLSCVYGAEEERRLIAFSETQQLWLTSAEVESLMVKKVNFIDITDHQNVNSTAMAVDPIPNQPIHKTLVGEITKLLSVENLKTDLNHLTTFNTRYYTSATGEAAAQWIYSEFEKIIGSTQGPTVQLFTHTWRQPSVIATIPGVGPNKDQVVIVGAHEDSVGSSSTGRSPGADDDGTGTVSVIELFRILIAAKFQPDRTLKFMTYAGEEAGLLGSAAIAASFKSAATPVHAVLQLDMTGYGGVDDIGIVTDFVDTPLTAFMRLLVDTYSTLDWIDTSCGYGCSDHASWTRNGYRASFTFETSFQRSNPYIHSANDVVSHISFERMTEFVKIGLGFLIELGGITIQP